jgi:hypothetical protein
MLGSGFNSRILAVGNCSKPAFAEASCSPQRFPAKHPVSHAALSTQRQFRKGFRMRTTEVFEYLKKHGQLLDSEIALATGISLDEVRLSLSELSAQGDISRCSVTSYVNGQSVEGFQCRIAGYLPRPAPGRKPGVAPKTSS